MTASIRAGLQAGCLLAVFLCPSPGRASTATVTCTPPSGTATAAPTATATPGTSVTTGLRLYLSHNVVHIEMDPLEVRVRLDSPDNVVLKIFTVAGDELKNERAVQVTNLVWHWDGISAGQIVPPGVYLVMARTDRGASLVRRFVLLR